MTFDVITMKTLGTGILEALYMIFLSSAIIYLTGISLGIVLVAVDEDGTALLPVLQKALGPVINLPRSIPFIILLIVVLPFTRLVVGTALGSKAIVVPLVIAVAPCVARAVESSFREVDVGVIEAAKSTGANTFQITWKVLLPEAKPSLLVGVAISVTTVLGYSAMAGFVGGGGLGAIAINYGYYRYDVEMVLVTVTILVIIVQIIQEPDTKLVKVGDKRVR